MTLTLNCKDAGDPVCTHTMYGETEEELFAYAKKHGIEVQGILKKRGTKRFQKTKITLEAL
jgi:hypothetical protein